MLQYLHERAKTHIRVKILLHSLFLHVYGLQKQQRGRELPFDEALKGEQIEKLLFNPPTHISWCEMTVCKQLSNKRIALSSDRVKIA